MYLLETLIQHLRLSILVLLHHQHIDTYNIHILYIVPSREDALGFSFFFLFLFQFFKSIVEEGMTLIVHIRNTESSYSLV